MSIDDLDLIPELTAPDDLTGDGLMPCWLLTTCFFIASRIWETDL